MEKRYTRNINTLSTEENDKLKDLKICIIGCGGLGGYLIEILGRLGIGHITAVDGDSFDETNLNRQILATEDVIGKSKAKTAKARMSQVNSLIEVTPLHTFLTSENCDEIIKGHNVVVDALDNMDSRRILEAGCERQGIPLVHGAIAGWFGQVSVIFPGDRLMEKIYPQGENKGEEVEMGNPAFTPALVASLEAAECIKLLLGKGKVLRHKMLIIDILENSYEVFEF